MSGDQTGIINHRQRECIRLDTAKFPQRVLYFAPMQGAGSNDIHIFAFVARMDHK
jgi:hypothetical protein